MSDVNGPQGLSAPSYEEMRSWPKVVGVISIIMGVIRFGCGGCQLAMPAMLKRFFPELFKGDVPPSFTPNALGIGLVVVASVVSVLLIVAGFMLVARNRKARSLHLVWTVLALVLGTAGMIWGWKVGQQDMAWYQANPESPLSKGKSETQLIVTLAIVGVIIFAYPVFCLVWFGLVKRNAAEIDAGVEESVV